jgi:hypothetical protein
MSTSDPSTQIISRVTGHDIWVIAARSGRNTRRVTLRGLPLGVRHGQRLDGKAFNVRGGALSDVFGHHRVHVYRFTRPS